MAKNIKKAWKSSQPQPRAKAAAVKTPKPELRTDEFKWAKGELERTRDVLNRLEVRGAPIQGAMKEAGAKQGDMYSVPIGSLLVNEEFNIRIPDAEYNERIRTIADSILEQGFLRDRPLTVMCIEQDGKTQLFVVDGHTRLLAAKLAISEGAKVDSLPVVAKSMGTTQEELLKALYTSNAGTPLKPLEFGHLLKRMEAATEQSLKALAKTFTVSEAYAEKCLALAGLPRVVRKMLTDNSISASTALGVSRAIRNPQDQIKAAQDAVAAAETRGSKVATVKDFPVLLAKTKGSRQFTSAIDFLVKKQAVHGETVPIDVLYELLSVSFDKPVAEILKQCKASAEVDAANATIVSRALTGASNENSRQLPLEGVAA